MLFANLNAVKTSQPTSFQQVTSVVILSCITALGLSACDRSESTTDVKADTETVAVPSEIETDSSTLDADRVNSQEANTITDKTPPQTSHLAPGQTPSIHPSVPLNDSINDNQVSTNNTYSAIEPSAKSAPPIATPTNQPSIVVSSHSKMATGSPESVLAKAMNTLYYGNASEAAAYYQTDMADFKQQLANTQPAFQQTVKKVTITDVIYNKDKTQAMLKGKIELIGVDQPDVAEFTLQKVAGQWKILG